MDSGCPASERSPSLMALTQVNLARHLSHVEEVSSLEEDLLEQGSKVDLEQSLMGGPSLTTPRGTHAILASQIDQEIAELRNFFDDHREEMLSLISAEQAPQSKDVPMASTGCSPITFDHQTKTSPKRSSRRKPSKKACQLIGDTSEETCPDVQEERRQEFEKFRTQKKLKRGKQQPQFAIGQPMTSTAEQGKISALFPRVLDDSAGRHVPTIDGDQVFIPKLNLDDQWSIEDPVQSKSLESKLVDKSCQVEKAKKRQARKKKPKDLSSFLDTLHLANEMATQLKHRSETLLKELQLELDLQQPSKPSQTFKTT